MSILILTFMTAIRLLGVKLICNTDHQDMVDALTLGSETLEKVSGYDTQILTETTFKLQGKVR